MPHILELVSALQTSTPPNQAHVDLLNACSTGVGSISRDRASPIWLGAQSSDRFLVPGLQKCTAGLVHQSSDHRCEPIVVRWIRYMSRDAARIQAGSPTAVLWLSKGDIGQSVDEIYC